MMSRNDRERTGAAILGSLTVAFVLLAALVADLAYFRHGYSATWYQRIDGERVLIDRTTEHRVGFPNVHWLLACYLQN